MRTCTKCGQSKPFSNFGTYSRKSKPSMAGKPHSACRQCKSKARRFKNRGITEEQFNTMMKDQRGRCYLCNEETTLHIDHNHETGQLRKLLCNTCNWKVGVLETTDEAWMTKARAYIDDL